MPNFLFLDTKTGAGGSTCAAYLYADATPTQIGNTFGTSITANASSIPRNQIINWQGDLYAVAQDGVYMKDDPTVMTGGWTQQLAFTNPDTGGIFFGIYAVDIGGQPYLTGVFQDNGGPTLWRWFKFDGTTWTQSASTTTSSDIRRVVTDVVYRNVIYLNGSGAEDMLTFDPASESFGSISGGVFAGFDPTRDLCVFQDRLFIVGENGTGNVASIWELIGGAWSLVVGDLQGAGSVGSDNTSGRRYTLFTDGTYMYAITSNDTAGSVQGFYANRIDSSLVSTDITTEVLPSGLVPTGKGGTGIDATGRGFFANYDLNTDPTTTTIYLYYKTAGGSGSNYSLYQWNYDPIANPPPDPANEITLLDTGGDVYHNPPAGYPNNGERIWTAGTLSIQIVGHTTAPGGREQIDFVAYGGGTGRTMKLYLGVDTEPVLVEATLALPVSGGSATFNSGLNQVENIDADGSTVYSIRWDFVMDGFMAGDRVIRVPQINSP